MAIPKDVQKKRLDIDRISNILHKNFNGIKYLKNACVGKDFDTSLTEDDRKLYKECASQLGAISDKLHTAYKKTINAGAITIRNKNWSLVVAEQDKVINQSKHISVELLKSCEKVIDSQAIQTKISAFDKKDSIDDLAELNNEVQIEVSNLADQDNKDKDKLKLITIENLEAVVGRLAKLDESLRKYDNIITKYLQLEVTSTVESDALEIVKGGAKVTYSENSAKHIKATNNALFVHKLFNLEKIYTQVTKATNEIEGYRLSVAKNVKPWTTDGLTYPTPEKVRTLFNDIKASEVNITGDVVAAKKSSDDAKEKIADLNNDLKIYKELVEELKFLVNSHTNGNQPTFLKLARKAVTDAGAKIKSQIMKSELGNLWDSANNAGLLGNAVANDALIQQIDVAKNTSLANGSAAVKVQNDELSKAQDEMRKLTQDGSWQEVEFKGKDDEGKDKTISMYLQNKAVLNKNGGI